MLAIQSHDNMIKMIARIKLAMMIIIIKLPGGKKMLDNIAN